MRKVKILSTGYFVPENILYDSDLDKILNLPKGESFRITGVKKRHQSQTETASKLAAKAIQQAMDKIKVSWTDIDCIIASSATMDKALPYNAAMIHAELGLNHRRTTTMDISASCMSFLTGLDMASCAIEAGRFETVVLVSSDISTFTLDYSNLRENGIFGDGAASVILSKTSELDKSKILSSSSVTISDGVDLCHINAGGSRYHRRVFNSNSDAVFGMNGKAVFGLVSKEISTFLDDLFKKSNVSWTNIDWIVPHQASRLALDHIVRRLHVPKEKVIDIFEDYGNQVGASLPTALHLGIESGKIHRGDTVLLVGTGAGLTIGGMVIVY